MDEIKKLASDATKTSASSEGKRLASDKPSSAEIPIPSPPPQVTTQVETGSRKDRIRKATLEGGLKNIPNGFDDRDGDWAIIKSENPFEVLYLDHEQYKSVTPEMVKDNFGILSDFWDGKIHQMMSSSAAKTQIIQKYGGEQGTEKTIQNYKRMLERAHKQLQSGIEKCFLEIDAKRLEIGRQHIQQTIEAILSDGIYMPDEKDTVLKYGWKANLRDDEILEFLIKHLEANGFYPLEKIKDGATNSEKVSVVWVTKDKAEEYGKHHGEGKKEVWAQQDSLTILERDFVAATKRDKALNINTANFLYDKGADLGLDNSTVVDLIKRWGDQYRVDIEEVVPRVTFRAEPISQELGQPKKKNNFARAVAAIVILVVGYFAYDNFIGKNTFIGKIDRALAAKRYFSPTGDNVEDIYRAQKAKSPGSKELKDAAAKISSIFGQEGDAAFQRLYNDSDDTGWDNVVMMYSFLSEIMPEDRELQARAAFSKAHGLIRGGKKSGFKEALSLYQKALQLKPNWVFAINGIAKVYVRKNSPYYNKVEALNWYNRACEADPNFPWAYTNIAAIYSEDRQWDMAEQALLKALNLKKDRPSILADLGNVCEKQGKKQDAVAYYQEALKYEKNAEKISFLQRKISSATMP